MRFFKRRSKRFDKHLSSIVKTMGLRPTLVERLQGTNMKTISEIGRNIIQVEPLPTSAVSDYTKTTDPHGWIQTYSGKKFFPMDPRVEDIELEDIAHALSNTCRFTGHCKKGFYSVAQHSVLVSYICKKENALYGLLHDASEAYLVDLAKPVKKLPEFQIFRDLEAKVMEAVCTKFGLPIVEPKDVKEADTIMLATEARDLMAPLHPDWKQPAKPLPFKIEPINPEEAKKLFLDRYRDLTDG